MSEKQMLAIHLDQKERLMKDIRERLRRLIPEEQGVTEALDRLSDRVRACKSLLQHPSLVPGGTSVLAQVSLCYCMLSCVCARQKV
jgi:predicted nuclease with TOPRIM domain